jgi:hypothetical protein
VSEPRTCSICGKQTAAGRVHVLGPEDVIRHLAANPDKTEAEIWEAIRPARNFASPEEVRAWRDLLTELRPDSWVGPLYWRAYAKVIEEGKKPTDARVAERLALDDPDGFNKETGARNVRRWRAQGLLRREIT